MTALATVLLAILWWLILRAPSAPPAVPYVTRRWQDALPMDERNAAQQRIWDDRHNAAGLRRDQLALRELRAAGEATRARWLAHHATRAKHARIPPTHWPRIAAGLEAAVEAAQPIVERRVVSIRTRRRA